MSRAGEELGSVPTSATVGSAQALHLTCMTNHSLFSFSVIHEHGLRVYVNLCPFSDGGRVSQ